MFLTDGVSVAPESSFNSNSGCASGSEVVVIGVDASASPDVSIEEAGWRMAQGIGSAALGLNDVDNSGSCMVQDDNNAYVMQQLNNPPFNSATNVTSWSSCSKTDLMGKQSVEVCINLDSSSKLNLNSGY